jgi:hypothetical protein
MIELKRSLGHATNCDTCIEDHRSAIENSLAADEMCGKQQLKHYCFLHGFGEVPDDVNIGPDPALLTSAHTHASAGVSVNSEISFYDDLTTGAFAIGIVGIVLVVNRQKDDQVGTERKHRSLAELEEWQERGSLVDVEMRHVGGAEEVTKPGI